MKLKSVPFIILLMLFALGCKQASDQVVFHKSHEPTKQDTPFSDVVESHGFLFLSGQVGVNHKTRALVEGGIEAVNRIYKTYFPNKPARTTFAASGLAINASIEIDVIASK